jgi:hypothetical protein
MDKLLPILYLSFIAYMMYKVLYKKLLKPLILKGIPKGIKHLDILYILALLLCLVYVPYKAGYIHVYHIVGTFKGTIDYFFLLYELVFVTVVYALIKLIVKRT